MRLIFLYLALANIVDGILTFIGLQFSFIQEGNPLMAFLYNQSPFLFIIFKVSLSCILFFFALSKEIPKFTILKGLTLFASFSYTIVLFLHGSWIIDAFV